MPAAPLEQAVADNPSNWAGNRPGFRFGPVPLPPCFNRSRNTPRPPLRPPLAFKTMPVIAIVNRKGGTGKSTLATHLAACFANSGVAVMLGDVDRQQSTQSWLRLRR